MLRSCWSRRSCSAPAMLAVMVPFMPSDCSRLQQCEAKGLLEQTEVIRADTRCLQEAVELCSRSRELKPGSSGAVQQVKGAAASWQWSHSAAELSSSQAPKVDPVVILMLH